MAPWRRCALHRRLTSDEVYARSRRRKGERVSRMRASVRNGMYRISPQYRSALRRCRRRRVAAADRDEAHHNTGNRKQGLFSPSIARGPVSLSRDQLKERRQRFAAVPSSSTIMFPYRRWGWASASVRADKQLSIATHHAPPSSTCRYRADGEVVQLSPAGRTTSAARTGCSGDSVF